MPTGLGKIGLGIFWEVLSVVHYAEGTQCWYWLVFPDLLVFFLGMFCYSSHGLTGWVTELRVGLVMTGDCSARQLVMCVWQLELAKATISVLGEKHQ